MLRVILYIKQQYSSECDNILYSVCLQAEERPLQRNEQLLADLRKRSTAITPLKLRHTPPSKTTTVESLCDWKTPKVRISEKHKVLKISL